jgi:adenylate kinase
MIDLEKKLRVVLLGPPGAGKGTQAELISRKYHIPHISTGDILRDAVRKNTKLGRQAQSFMEKGELVPDEVVFALVKERIDHKDCENGAIFDGFPRNINQAQMLQNLEYIKQFDCFVVLLILIPDHEAIRRLSNRRYCPNCKSIYNLLNLPSRAGLPCRQAGKMHQKRLPAMPSGRDDNYLCDKCGEKLIIRDDDKVETVKHRLQVYHDTVEPVISFYKDLGNLHTINGIKGKENVFEEIVNTVDKLITKDCKNGSNKK